MVVILFIDKGVMKLGFLRKLLARFGEASTWAGVGALAQAAKVFVPQYAGVLDGVTMAAGSLAVGIPDKGEKPLPELIK